MTGRELLLGGVVVGALACGERAPAPKPADATPPAAPADSLVATAPGGAEVWFTLARCRQRRRRAAVPRERSRFATAPPGPRCRCSTPPPLPRS